MWERSRRQLPRVPGRVSGPISRELFSLPLGKGGKPFLTILPVILVELWFRRGGHGGGFEVEAGGEEEELRREGQLSAQAKWEV